MNSFLRNVGFYLLVIFIAITAYDYFSVEPKPVQETSYSQFVEMVEQGEVTKVVLLKNTIKVTKKDGSELSTIAPDEPIGDKTLVEKLEAKGVEIVAQNPKDPPWWMTLLTSLFPIILLVAFWYFMIAQSQGGGNKVFSFGKSRAKMMGGDKVKVKFTDVAGADEAKEELAEVVEFLKYPKKFNDLGARIPKGVLLFGPPGTGKTLLAKAVAGEAGVAFFSISGSDFVEMFVGVGASRVRDLFAQAKKNSPCIIFIDEIDAVGRQRGAAVGGGHDEREQTLNQLLVEMDGFAANEGIIIIAATNRPDILDKALLRPGRFDRQIVVDKPDLTGRIAILQVHTKGKPIAKDADLDILARRTPGFTGADLANLVNEAALLAARRNKHQIDMTELEESIERVMAGPERKSKVMSDHEKKLTAYHEGGHALVGMMLKHADPVHKVTIIPRGRAGGYTLMLPKEDRSYATRSELLDRLKVSMGGRVAEEVVLNEISTGASQDIQQASQIVRAMIMQYGMSNVLGFVSYGGDPVQQYYFGQPQKNYSEEVAGEIDKEIHRYMSEAYEDCRKIITDNRDKLDAIAKALIDKETLTAQELKDIVFGKELPKLPEDNPPVMIEKPAPIDETNLTDKTNLTNETNLDDEQPPTTV
ncbi:MAG: ATP-dependent zinc metalloprotease FtsH [Selenomonadaceae bacterium]|nr:ATP-dependent zinc metalloprotease FtsH [Selenomonadaceae bacterium]